jgi:hypothetical protein
MSTHKTRIMYIERKAESLNGPARIGRVTFSKSGRSVTYRGQEFLKIGSGYKYSHIDAETGDNYWISGPKRGGGDRLYPQSTQPVEIDDDVREEYWTLIRQQADFKARTTANQR